MKKFREMANMEYRSNPSRGHVQLALQNLLKGCLLGAGKKQSTRPAKNSPTIRYKYEGFLYPTFFYTGTHEWILTGGTGGGGERGNNVTNFDSKTLSISKFFPFWSKSSLHFVRDMAVIEPSELPLIID